MRTFLLAGLAIGCGGGGGSTIDAPPFDGDVGAHVDAPGDPLVGVGDVELVQGGYQFVEGPQWRDATADLVFSDIDGNTIYRYDPATGDPPVAFRTPSQNSNGLALDTAGDLIACEHGSRSVTRTTTAGTTTIVDHYQGMRLNSPNDAIVALDGTIYFTDPPYGITDAQRELPFVGVFRIDPSGALSTIHEGALTERSNGVVLDDRAARLLVADTSDGNVYQYALAGGPRTPFLTTSGNPDGMAIDTNANLFVATATGIEVFAATGDRWGVIAVPEQPANCAFGDADHRTLYITARTGLYRVRLAGPGVPRS
jgi:gluconolactonase